MANSSGKELNNRKELCSMLEIAYNEGRLVEASLPTEGNVYCLLNEEKIVTVALDKATGNFLEVKGKMVPVKAGTNKSNKRQYINMPLKNNPKYMCANYTFRVIAEGLLSNDPKHRNRYNKFKDGLYVYRLYTKEECKELGFDPKEGMMGPCYDLCDINHINGDTTDNRDVNLEVDTKAMNIIHARLMGEVAYYHPELIDTCVDCQGNNMHKWIDEIGLSCTQIREWNSSHRDTIKPFKDKKGEWTPKLTKEQVDKILRYFGKI